MDSVYRDHYAVVQLLASSGIGTPGELISISGETREYRTLVPCTAEPGVTAYISTCFLPGGTVDIYVGRSLDCGGLSTLPIDQLPGRRLRFRNAGPDYISEYTPVAMQSLGLVPKPQKRERKKKRDAVEIRDGVRIINYEKLRRQIPPTEENVLDYSIINRRNK